MVNRNEVALRGKFEKDLPEDTRAVNLLVISKISNEKNVVVDLTIDCPADVEYEDCVKRFKALNPGYFVSIWAPFNKEHRGQEQTP